MKKFFVLIAVLLMCAGSAHAAAVATSNGSEYIKAAPFGELVFDDLVIPGRANANFKATTFTYWSNIYDISAYEWNQGTTNNKLYLSFFLAAANTSTSSNGQCSVTYQTSLDGKNWVNTGYVQTAPTQAASYGLFGTSLSDSFDPGDTIFRNGLIWAGPSTTYGAGPYNPTLTQIVLCEVSPTKYIRFKPGNSEITNAITVDFGFMRGTR